jgi:hypothetical protein
MIHEKKNKEKERKGKDNRSKAKQSKYQPGHQKGTKNKKI